MLERRHFLAAGALSTLIGPSSVSLAQAPALAGAPMPVAWNDGLAHPIPYAPPPGIGKERGLVLGGGGTYLASWMAGYFTSLKSKGVDVAQADIAVGTSAGSVMGATLMGGHL